MNNGIYISDPLAFAKDVGAVYGIAFTEAVIIALLIKKQWDEKRKNRETE